MSSNELRHRANDLARADTEAGLVGCLAAGPGSFFLPRNRRVTVNLALEMTDLAREARDLTAQTARFEPTTLELQPEVHPLFCSFAQQTLHNSAAIPDHS